MRNQIIIILIGFSVLLVGCALSAPQVVPDEAVITIVEPVEGTQYQVGDLVKVRARVSSSVGAQEIDLFINASIVRRDHLDVPLRQGNVLQPWQPTEPGDYLIQVSMTAVTGNSVQSNAVLILVAGEEQPPPTAIQPTTQVPEVVMTITPTITPTPTETHTLTPIPSITPSLTYPPTNTFIPTVESLTAPEPIAPSGQYSCRSTVFLEWNSVFSVNGISYYEWVVEKPGESESGTTSDVQVEFFIPGCSATYRWQVRAVDGLGNIGPFSPWIDFTIE